MKIALPETYQARTNALTQLLVEETANDIIPFSRFMEAALYMPQLGYYASGQNTFENNGDFTTAPHVSRFFSMSIARQCEDICTELSHPIILECGAGTGRMAADILKYLDTSSALPEAYWILEPSSALKAVQFETISSVCHTLVDRVKWLEKLPETPFEGVILGNEVIDAMPVHAWKIKDNELVERGVRFNHTSDQWEWVDCPSPSESCQKACEPIIKEYGPFEEGYCSEVNPYYEPWLRSLNDVLTRGVMLWIDYGHEALSYYHASRKRGTLMSYFQHKAFDNPLSAPGCMDITAHVNFSFLAEAALEVGLDLLGYTPQMMFLAGCGIETCLQTAVLHEPELTAQYQAEIQHLMSPQYMGDKFKVIAFGKDWHERLTAFQFNDCRHKL